MHETEKEIERAILCGVHTGSNNVLEDTDEESMAELRELAYEDLDRAMALSLERSIERIRMKGAEPYKDTIDACQWYNTLE